MKERQGLTISLLLFFQTRLKPNCGIVYLWKMKLENSETQARMRESKRELAVEALFQKCILLYLVASQNHHGYHITLLLLVYFLVH